MPWTAKQLRQTIKERLGESLFIVVSNREPYIHQYEGGEIVCETPASGLTIALDPVVRAAGGVWIAHGSGDADRDVVDAHGHVRVPPEQPAYTLRRVWLSREEEDLYYDGFANSALWPLCHIAYHRPSFRQEEWEAYRAVNRKFADAVLQEVGDRRAFVFIQDYHFALLPRMLKRPNIRTAQFWHIPWPNREAFRICPWGEELLDGMLGNDLLGFHIGYHCQNFLDTVDRTIEARVDYERSTVTRGGLTTQVRPFPISVDFDALAARADGPAVRERMAELARTYHLRDQVVGLGVDRIDYTKGIPERLHAVDRLMARHPELAGKFTFVQIGVPSRTRIAAYQALTEEIEGLVHRINWKHRAGLWMPIVYQRRHVSPEELSAWYRLCDFCVVSSLHDGMNLVAKEFLASRTDDRGVLLVSRFAGAAGELADAEPINPYAVDDVAERMYQASVMPPEEQQRRMRRMRAHLAERNIYRWAGQVLSSLFDFEFQEANAGGVATL